MTDRSEYKRLARKLRRKMERAEQMGMPKPEGWLKRKLRRARKKSEQ